MFCFDAGGRSPPPDEKRERPDDGLARPLSSQRRRSGHLPPGVTSGVAPIGAEVAAPNGAVMVGVTASPRSGGVCPGMRRAGRQSRPALGLARSVGSYV